MGDVRPEIDYSDTLVCAVFGGGLLRWRPLGPLFGI
jgi:hypothetical protein